MSGFEDIRVAIGLWSVAGIWTIIALFTWEPVRNRLSIIKRLRITLQPITNDKGNIPANLVSPDWLQEILTSDLKRINESVIGKIDRWDFSGIYKREPYFEVFIKLTNTTVFTFRLIGASGFVKVAGEPCGNPPQVTSRAGIDKTSPVDIRIRQHISPETSQIIESAGKNNKEIQFDFREVVFGIENTTKGYEQYKPYLRGGEYNLVPKDGLESIKQ